MPVRWFYDTEFIEGPGREIQLVSLGVVREDGGAQYYAVSTEFDPAAAGEWVRRNVLDQLPSPAAKVWRSRAQIRADLERLLLGDAEPPELWAWYGAYDHVVLCQLWGTMPQLPRRMPRFTRDLRQLWEEVGCPALPEQRSGQHDALADAQHNRLRWEAMAALRAGVGRA